jgi:hypothetical protein
MPAVDRHAPGPVPRPLAADLDADPPASRLPGQAGHGRNPPAARRDQAERLLALL